MKNFCLKNMFCVLIYLIFLLKKLYVKKNGLFLLQPKLSELIHPNEF